jgi:hypothetical protein
LFVRLSLDVIDARQRKERKKESSTVTSSLARCEKQRRRIGARRDAAGCFERMFFEVEFVFVAHSIIIIKEEVCAFIPASPAMPPPPPNNIRDY